MEQINYSNRKDIGGDTVKDNFISKMKDYYQKIFSKKNYTCDNCAREIFQGEGLCSYCLQKLPFNDGQCCQICGRAVAEGIEVCKQCLQDRPIYILAKSNFIYDAQIQKLLYRFKNGDRYLVNTFIPFADFFLASGIFDVDYIVYVPMFYRDERKRGYNQAAVLATALGKRYAIPVAHDKIIKIKHTVMQKTLNKVNRMQNLKESIMLIDKNFFRGKKVLLVDDILTTGATSDTIGKCLKEGGCIAVYLYTIASVSLQRDG